MENHYNPVVEAVANKFGIPSFDLAKGVQDMYGKAIGFANMTTAELEAAAQSYNDKVSKTNQDNVSRVGTDRAVQAAALSRSYGATPSQIASHIDRIGRGDAAPGTSANALGGSSSNDFSTNDRNEVVGPDVHSQLQKAKELDIDINSVVSPTQRENMKNGFKSKDLEKEIERKAKDFAISLDRFERKGMGSSPDKSSPPGVGAAGDPEGNPGSERDGKGGIDSPGSTPGGGPEKESDTQNDMSSEMGNEQEGGYMNIGGLASKPKRKKQKKMKRGGLASR